MQRGTHGEKIVAAQMSDKLPTSDYNRLEQAVNRYDSWIEDLNCADGNSLEELVIELVRLLNDYKLYVDVDLIFDSENDFLYRQKGQLKLDNTVMEEFLPIFVKKMPS